MSYHTRCGQNWSCGRCLLLALLDGSVLEHDGCCHLLRTSRLILSMCFPTSNLQCKLMQANSSHEQPTNGS